MPTGHVIDSRPPVMSKLLKERFSRNVIHRKPAFPISPTGGLTISFISVVSLSLLRFPLTPRLSFDSSCPFFFSYLPF